jgi:hypothetical protein
MSSGTFRLNPLYALKNVQLDQSVACSVSMQS